MKIMKHNPRLFHLAPTLSILISLFFPESPSLREAASRRKRWLHIRISIGTRYKSRWGTHVLQIKQNLFARITDLNRWVYRSFTCPGWSNWPIFSPAGRAYDIVWGAKLFRFFVALLSEIKHLNAWKNFTVPWKVSHFRKNLESWSEWGAQVPVL